MANDIYYANTSLLIHGNGLDNEAIFSDSSSHNFAITAHGNIKTSKDITLISTSSIKATGATTRDYLSVGNATDLQFGTGDFSIEIQIYPTNFSQDTFALLHKGNDFLLYLPDSSHINLFSPRYSFNFSVSFSFSVNTKYQIGVKRVSGVLSFWINGTKIGADFSSTHNFDGTSQLLIAAYIDSGYERFFIGYLSEIRITKGMAADLSAIQSVPFNSKALDIVLSESIAPTQFILRLYELITGAYVQSQTLTAGSYTVSVLNNNALMAVMMPVQGDVWKKSTAYAVNDLVFPTDPATTPYYYKRINAGTSGTTEPTWVTTTGQQCNDGAVNNAWECVARLTQPITQSPLIPV